jgi:hypothetical protein
LSIYLNFEKGTVFTQLSKLEENIKQKAYEAMDEAASFMIVMAKSYCPVDTGTLMRSIRKQSVPPKAVIVIAGGRQYVNPRTRKGCIYAAIVESRQPFMHPAWESTRPFVLAKIKEKVLEANE